MPTLGGRTQISHRTHIEVFACDAGNGQEAGGGVAGERVHWAVIMGIAMSIAQAATINVNWLITIIGARRCVFSPLSCPFQATHCWV